MDHSSAFGINARLEKFPMGLTVLYRNPQRPDEAGLVVVPDRAKASEIKDQLENRGFVIIEIATAPFAKARYQYQSD